jgi:hypothetical protein
MKKPWYQFASAKLWRRPDRPHLGPIRAMPLRPSAPASSRSSSPPSGAGCFRRQIRSHADRLSPSTDKKRDSKNGRSETDGRIDVRQAQYETQRPSNIRRLAPFGADFDGWPESMGVGGTLWLRSQSYANVSLFWPVKLRKQGFFCELGC